MSQHVRAQKKNQNARQAMVISGLNTIYRNTTRSHAIKTNQQSEPRIYFLDLSLDDINTNWSKINQIIEKGRLVNGNGCATYHVTTKTEHLIITENDIYEITVSQPRGGNGRDRGRDRVRRDREQCLHRRIPVDGDVFVNEITRKVGCDDGDKRTASREYTVPLLIDESYYELNHTRDETATHLPPNHNYIIRVKKTIKFYAGAPNAFVFVFDSDAETRVVDFYMTTEDGIISIVSANGGDRLNNTFKEDMISFLLHFKLCS
jgi:hypothetical protein